MRRDGIPPPEGLPFPSGEGRGGKGVRGCPLTLQRRLTRERASGRVRMQSCGENPQAASADARAPLHSLPPCDRTPHRARSPAARIPPPEGLPFPRGEGAEGVRGFKVAPPPPF